MNRASNLLYKDIPVNILQGEHRIQCQLIASLPISYLLPSFQIMISYSLHAFDPQQSHSAVMYDISVQEQCSPSTCSATRSITCRGAVRLFSEFYQSDIIVASPLAVATLLGEAPADGETGAPADFLSSIEVAVVVRADVMCMQNWAHVKLGARYNYCHSQALKPL